MLAASGFLGGGEGPADLSERYKDRLAEAIERKLPSFSVQEERAQELRARRSGRRK